jgi:hypothetical protein
VLEHGAAGVVDRDALLRAHGREANASHIRVPRAFVHSYTA